MCKCLSDILINVWVLGLRLRIVRLSDLEASKYPLTSSEHFLIEKCVSVPVIFLFFVYPLLYHGLFFTVA